ncbi:hypothetical protein BJP25_20790 [Actinokineospora bangkokensis]|uniref:AAA+ ATPase domain-containing protein n=2 Tax=Actinokineospora bangkokensis TaxID=1193682 RepID=A0A1Q9LKF7_9PSEU|nr:hypothetical protein BJP25_20790 [Actinokineospora bangkokensis]
MNLSVGHGDRVVLRDRTAHARAGAVTVVLGPAGTGKSTLLGALAGLHPVLAGAVSLDGTDLTALPAAERPRRARLVTFPEAQVPPALVLVDSPETALDPHARARLADHLHGLARARNRTVLVSTRDPHLVRDLADSVWLLTQAGGLRTGTPEQLTRAGLLPHVSAGRPALAVAQRPRWHPVPTEPAEEAAAREIRVAPEEDVRRAIAEAAAGCRYLDTADEGVPLPRLTAGSAALSQLIDSAAAVVGTQERRVAASLLHFRLVAALVSLALGAPGVVPDLSRLRVRADATTTIRLSLPEPRGWRTPAALPLLTRVLRDRLHPLHDALRTTAKLPVPLMWGNVAASLAHRLAASPDPATRGLVQLPELRGALTSEGVRRSCCLHYRTSAATTCHDCPLGQRAAMDRAC